MSNRRSDHSESSLPPAKRRSRLVLGILFSAVLLMAFYAFGGLRAALHLAVKSKLHERDYEAAEQWLNWCTKLTRPNGETHFLTARNLRKQLQISDVPKLLKLAADSNFDKDRIKLEYMLLEAQTGRLPSVATELQRRLQSEDPDGREICEAYVNGALILGSYTAAETIFDAWENEYAEDPQPHYLRSRIHEHHRSIDKAVEQLQLALSKNVRHWPSRYSLSRIYFGQNKFDEAIEQVEPAISMIHNVAPLYQKAQCLRARSQLHEAKQILELLVARPRLEMLRSFALVAEPEQGYPVEYELGLVEAALDNHREAVKWLDVVLDHDANHLDARYSRALSLREIGEHEKAASELEEVSRVRNLLLEVDRLIDQINEAPHEPHLEARCRIGELFLKYQSAKQGVYWLQDTLNWEPNYSPAHRLLREHYEKLSKTSPEWAAVAEEHRRRAEGSQ